MVAKAKKKSSASVDKCPSTEIAISAGENTAGATATSASGGSMSSAESVESISQRPAESCPYCESVDFVKRGVRKNKFGEAQLYLCRNPLCGRTFTARDIKGKKFPLRIVIDAMSYYNLGFTLEYSCALLKKKFGSAPDPQTLSGWIEEYKPLCRYERLRPWAVKYCKPQEKNPKGLTFGIKYVEFKPFIDSRFEIKS